MEYTEPFVSGTEPNGADTGSSGSAAFASWHPNKMVRKAIKKKKRYENQVDRARIREDIQAGMRDPENFLDLDTGRKNTRRQLSSGAVQRRWLLYVQIRKVKSELANTRDLDTFIQKTSRSKTLYALASMGFFRHVLRSDEYREDHRYKLAIRKAIEEPGLSKAIQHKWENLDRDFPDRSQKQIW